ncbi:MAG: ABC transporter ATP-binding protein [Clostridiales bacterium]|nr:ABC transporter ATP-binding protein [Clostridiales bacterium]
MTENKPLLNIRNLKVVFPSDMGVVRAVEGIDLSVHAGECAAIVGESGCGKSVTSMAIMRLLNSPPALMQADEMTFDGHDLLSMEENELCELRGKDICMIFQDALTALNPVMTIGRQMDEIFLRHQKMSKKEAKKASIDALSLVGVPSPERRYHDYPHQLSGGMRQRVLIAMAFAVKPKLIIADEPTTALDVTIQAQVLDVLKKMQKENGTALILITHDLSVVAHMADTVHVMYSGKLVEEAPLRELFLTPHHPYTQGLLASVPKLDQCTTRFVQIPDQVPNPMHKPTGCYFHPRCNYCTAECKEKMPVLKEDGENRRIRCHHPLV